MAQNVSHAVMAQRSVPIWPSWPIGTLPRIPLIRIHLEFALKSPQRDIDSEHGHADQFDD